MALIRLCSRPRQGLLLCFSALSCLFSQGCYLPGALCVFRRAGGQLPVVPRPLWLQGWLTRVLLLGRELTGEASGPAHPQLCWYCDRSLDFRYQSTRILSCKCWPSGLWPLLGCSATEILSFTAYNIKLINSDWVHLQKF